MDDELGQVRSSATVARWRRFRWLLTAAVLFAIGCVPGFVRWEPLSERERAILELPPERARAAGRDPLPVLWTRERTGRGLNEVVLPISVYPGADPNAVATFVTPGQAPWRAEPLAAAEQGTQGEQPRRAVLALARGTPVDPVALRFLLGALKRRGVRSARLEAEGTSARRYPLEFAIAVDGVPDRTVRALLTEFGHTATEVAALAPDPPEPLRMRVSLDRSDETIGATGYSNFAHYETLLYSLGLATPRLPQDPVLAIPAGEGRRHLSPSGFVCWNEPMLRYDVLGLRPGRWAVYLQWEPIRKLPEGAELRIYSPGAETPSVVWRLDNANGVSGYNRLGDWVAASARPLRVEIVAAEGTRLNVGALAFEPVELKPHDPIVSPP